MHQDSGNTRQMTGRADEAGADGGHDDLRNEGRVDHAVAGVKEAVDGVADKVRGFLHRGDR